MGVQLGAVHPIKLWIHPLEICKISKRNMLNSLLKKPATLYPIHVLPRFNRCGWKQLIFEMYVYSRYFTQIYRPHYVITALILWSLTKVSFTLIYIIYTQNISIIKHYIIKVYTYKHPHWQPLHSLCSWSGYGPDHNVIK
jgi:hypothetical protein